MKIISFVLSIALALIALDAGAKNLKQFDSAISKLHAVEPVVHWDVKTAVTSDVTCDGKSDIVIVGYEKNNIVWLGVILGGESNKEIKPITMSFTVNNENQASFCSVPVEIETQPIVCEDEDIGKLPGCKQVKGCSEFSMIDNACDSFHFYWDSTQKKLVWWRR
jgi:hypothetical protein